MKIGSALRRALLAGIVAALAMTAPAIAQNIRGSATGPTAAKGYDHPDQFIHLTRLPLLDSMQDTERR
jgi:arylsulfatase